MNATADWSPGQPDKRPSRTPNESEADRSPASPKDSGQNDDAVFDDGTEEDELEDDDDELEEEEDEE